MDEARCEGCGTPLLGVTRVAGSVGRPQKYCDHKCRDKCRRMKDAEDGTVFEVPVEPKTPFEAWLETSKPGSSFTYHTGTVLTDARISQFAKEAFKAGRVELLQKVRVVDGERIFDWLAIKRKNVKPPTVHGFPWCANAVEYRNPGEGNRAKNDYQRAYRERKKA